MGGVKKGRNLDYVIFEWSLIGTEKARLEKLKAEFTAMLSDFNVKLK